MDCVHLGCCVCLGKSSQGFWELPKQSHPSEKPGSQIQSHLSYLHYAQALARMIYEKVASGLVWFRFQSAVTGAVCELQSVVEGMHAPGMSPCKSRHMLCIYGLYD